MSAPIRAQYLRLKQPFPDALLLFRLGDLYELYDEDARVAARELGVALTARAVTGGKRVPMCPLPYHAVEGHIKRLVARGYKVAIAEQIGTPRILTAHGLVAREVVRVVTPASAIEAHRHPPSRRLIGPSGAETDGSDMPRSSGGTAASVPCASADVSATSPASVSDAGGEERAAAPAVQLALFESPTEGDDRGR